MGKVRVWTKQHESVMETILKTGRYTAKRQYISMDLKECADVVLEVYDWLVKNCPSGADRPADAEMPVWVSLQKNTAMLPSPGTALLELEVEEELLIPLNISKWGTMLNYSYIPLDEADKMRHHELLETLGISDFKAYTTPFYPMVKREITASWPRLFDRSILIDKDAKEYGLLWEIKKEWIRDSRVL